MLESRRLLVNNASTAAFGSAIGDAVAYIDIKYKEDITLNQLCEISGYSHQHFAVCSKRRWGCVRWNTLQDGALLSQKRFLPIPTLPLAKSAPASDIPNPHILEWFSENMKEFLQVNIENAETVLKYSVHQYTCTPEDSLIIIWHGNSTLTYS